jgi:hypothetical protein
LALRNISFDTKTTLLKLQAGGRLDFVYQNQIRKHLRSPEMDSKELILPAFVACAGIF